MSQGFYLSLNQSKTYKLTFNILKVLHGNLRNSIVYSKKHQHPPAVRDTLRNGISVGQLSKSLTYKMKSLHRQTSVRLERWSSSHEPRLLFKRTQVKVPEPLWWLRAICNSNPREFDALFLVPMGTNNVHDAQLYRQVKYPYS